MNTEMETLIKKLNRELLITRIFTIILGGLIVTLLLGGVWVYGQASEYAQYMESSLAEIEDYAAEIRPAIEKLGEVDMQAVNDTLVTLNETMNTVNWEQVTEQLNDLDIDSINKAIDGLDTQELSVTLRNLNDVVEKLQNISDGMKSFFSKFTN